MGEFISQAIGIVAATFVILSFQQREAKTVIRWQMMGQLLFSVNYFMLGASTGACLNLLGVLRGIVYSNRERFHAGRLCWVFIFTGAFFGVYLAGFLFFGVKVDLEHLALELMPVVAMTFSTISFRAEKSAVVRRLGLISSPLWLAYNAINFTIGGIICEVFNLISIIIGIIRLDITRAKTAEK